MIPESTQSGFVKLYESVIFSVKWKEACGFIDEPLRDPTFFTIRLMIFYIGYNVRNQTLISSLHLDLETAMLFLFNLYGYST